MPLTTLASAVPSWAFVGAIFVTGWLFEFGWGTAGRLATLETKMDIVQADVTVIRQHLLGDADE